MRISDWSSDVCSSDLFEVAVAQVAGATGALGHVFAGQFQVHAAQARAGRGVDVERLLDLAAAVAEATGLVAVARRLGVRSEELREGKECVGTCGSRWCPYH